MDCRHQAIRCDRCSFRAAGESPQPPPPAQPCLTRLACGCDKGRASQEPVEEPASLCGLKTEPVIADHRMAAFHALCAILMETTINMTGCLRIS